MTPADPSGTRQRGASPAGPLVDPVNGPIDEAEVAELRARTPGTAERAHLNNAGAGLMSAATLDAVVGHLQREAHLGGYEAAEIAADDLAGVRSSAAQLLGAEPGEVAVATSDTAAWASAFWGFVFGGGLDDRPRVVVDRVSYNSHWFALLQAAKHRPLDLHVVDPGPDGVLDLAALERALAEPTALLSITHVPTHSGAVAPVEAAGELARAAGAVYALDACQSVGQLPVDVAAIRCDIATVTGRKWLRGPRGTGLLYVAGSMVDRLDPPGIDATSASWPEAWRYELAPDAARFEHFEGPIAAQLGLGVAIDETLAIGVDRVATRIGELADHLRSELGALAGVELTDGDGPRGGIVTFASERCAPADLVAAATEARINIGTSRAATARLDLDPRGLDEVVRVSPHAYNTVDELDVLLDVVSQVS